MYAFLIKYSQTKDIGGKCLITSSIYLIVRLSLYYNIVRTQIQLFITEAIALLSFPQSFVRLDYMEANFVINHKQLPIGVFDSGMGGISVLATLMQEMPNEKFIYFGDSANAPYGIKTVDQVKTLTIRACDYLISKGVKAIVVACNTATSAAIRDLRERYTIPVIGMEPALKPAVEGTPAGSIAVMATPMTLQEKKFEKLMMRYGDQRHIVKVPCPELVELVEAHHVEDQQVEDAILKCFQSVDSAELGAVVLGCTHYVFLRSVLNRVFKGAIQIIDGNMGTARQVKRLLKKNDLMANQKPIASDRVFIINSKSNNLVDQSWSLLEYMLTQEVED